MDNWQVKKSNERNFDLKNLNIIALIKYKKLMLSQLYDHNKIIIYNLSLIIKKLKIIKYIFILISKVIIDHKYNRSKFQE